MDKLKNNDLQILTDASYAEMLDRAEKSGACADVLAELREMSVAEALAHTRAPEWMCWYACHVVRDRWPEGEAIIARDPTWAYWYARDVVEDRWPEAEATIARDPHWACCYARDVVKGRWPAQQSCEGTT